MQKIHSENLVSRKNHTSHGICENPKFKRTEPRVTGTVHNNNYIRNEAKTHNIMGTIIKFTITECFFFTNTFINKY